MTLKVDIDRYTQKTFLAELKPITSNITSIVATVDGYLSRMTRINVVFSLSTSFIFFFELNAKSNVLIPSVVKKPFNVP